MENCFYNRKAISTFELKDESGLYYEDTVLEWKQVAAERLLTCVECGAHVYLAAGPIKEPYFAHYDKEDCDYGNGQESEEMKKGKRLLYQLIKRSFPDGTIQARYRMDNGMYSTLHCLVETGQSLAVDYRLQNNSLEKFRMRDTFYQMNNIRPLYIMGIRQMKDTKQIDWYQSLLQTSMGYLAFLDTKKECLTLKKSFGYRIGNDREFLYCTKTYFIKELVLDAEGQMICDFTEECNKIEEQIKEEKLRYQIRRQKLRDLEEERLRLEAKELERLEAYRKARVQSEKDYHTQIIEDLKEKEKVNQKDQENLKKQENQKVQKYQKDQDDLKKKEVIKLTDQQLMQMGLIPAIYEKCLRMIEEGDSNLVSKKYYDAIMGNL